MQFHYKWGVFPFGGMATMQWYTSRVRTVTLPMSGQHSYMIGWQRGKGEMENLLTSLVVDSMDSMEKLLFWKSHLLGVNLDCRALPWGGALIWQHQLDAGDLVQQVLGFLSAIFRRVERIYWVCETSATLKQITQYIFRGPCPLLLWRQSNFFLVLRNEPKNEQREFSNFRSDLGITPFQNKLLGY